MIDGHGQKLDRRREAAIAALLSCGSIREAAAQAKLGEATLRRWLHEPTFRAAYDAARRDVLHAAVAGLHGTLATALGALQRNLAPTAPPAAQVSAARTVVELVLKSTHLLDHEDRLAALERQTGPSAPLWPFTPSTRPDAA